jgi:hypothetical protein
MRRAGRQVGGLNLFVARVAAGDSWAGWGVDGDGVARGAEVAGPREGPAAELGDHYRFAMPVLAAESLLVPGAVPTHPVVVEADQVEA